jgi:hypothetical protein
VQLFLDALLRRGQLFPKVRYYECSLLQCEQSDDEYGCRIVGMRYDPYEETCITKGAKACECVIRTPRRMLHLTQLSSNYMRRVLGPGDRRNFAGRAAIY